MNKLKRPLSILLAITMVLSMGITGAFATDAPLDNLYDYLESEAYASSYDVEFDVGDQEETDAITPEAFGEETAPSSRMIAPRVPTSINVTTSADASDVVSPNDEITVTVNFGSVLAPNGEPIAIWATNGAEILINDITDVRFSAGGELRPIRDIATGDGVVRFMSGPPVSGLLANQLTFSIQAPPSAGDFTLTVRVGLETATINPASNFAQRTFRVGSHFTVNTTLDVVNRNQLFEVYGEIDFDDVFLVGMKIYNRDTGVNAFEATTLDLGTALDIANGTYSMGLFSFDSSHAAGIYVVETTIVDSGGYDNIATARTYIELVIPELITVNTTLDVVGENEPFEVYGEIDFDDVLLVAMRIYNRGTGANVFEAITLQNPEAALDVVNGTYSMGSFVLDASHAAGIYVVEVVIVDSNENEVLPTARREIEHVKSVSVPLITRLNLSNHIGDINQDNRTITFAIEPDALDYRGALVGVLDMEADGHNSLHFDVWGGAWDGLVSQGTDGAGIWHSDRVWIPGFEQYYYTIEFEVVTTARITRLNLGSHVGEIDSDNRTITFTVYESDVRYDGMIGGTLDFAAGSSSLLYFRVGAWEGPLANGAGAWVTSGNEVWPAPNGLQYEVVVVVRPDPIPTPDYHIVTIRAVHVDTGEELIEATTQQHAFGSSFAVVSPSISGHRLAGALVNGNRITTNPRNIRVNADGASSEVVFEFYAPTEFNVRISAELVGAWRWPEGGYTSGNYGFVSIDATIEAGRMITISPSILGFGNNYNVNFMTLVFAEDRQVFRCYDGARANEQIHLIVDRDLYIFMHVTNQRLLGNFADWGGVFYVTWPSPW